MMRIYYIYVLLLATLLSACPAADYMPVYFPASADEGAGTITAPPTPVGSAASSCTIQFTSSICVVLKRGTWSVGAEGQEPICASDLKPIPIHIDGGKATLRGDEFPDVLISGHGLDAPLTINGKGSTDGSDNIGEGATDASGNITIKNFAFYATIIGKVGKIPDITLTTGTAEGSKDLPDMHGVPASGAAMTLVASKILGPILPAADKYLLGGTMQVTFKGTISPKLSDCNGSSSGLPTSVQVTKIAIDAQKQQHEQSIPAGTQMEVASNVMIPANDKDVGSEFEGISRFRIRNIGKKSIALQIPPILGAFRIKALTGDLTKTLPAQQAIVVEVTFHPATDAKAGRVQETLSLGSDYFTLIGVAQAQRGVATIHTTDSTGTVSSATDTVSFPEVGVAAFSRQAYFQCDAIDCSGVPSPTHCQDCIDVASGKCRLLSVDRDNLPIGEVDNRCTALRPKAKESQGINLAGSKMGSTSQTIVIQNDGTKAMTITSFAIQDIAKSHSMGQFQVNPQAVYMGKDASAIGTTSPVKLPQTLLPHSDQKMFVVVTYSPTDLQGSDDDQGNSSALDQALLTIGTEQDKHPQFMHIKLRGSTAVRDTPPIEVYFKTNIGFRMREDGSDFALKGITQTTHNASAPVKIKLADAAGTAYRITNVELTGGDTDHFSFLDSSDKIAALPKEESCDTTDAPVAVRPNGLDIAPQAYTLQTMPLLGCIHFHNDPEKQTTQHIYNTQLTVTAVALDSKNQPVKRDDGSLSESKVNVHIQAVISPRKGPQVFRIVQTMAILMTGQRPTVASTASIDEYNELMKGGRTKEGDKIVSLAAMTLDPFDEMTIHDESGNVVSTPDDGKTAVFRPLDTRPSDFAGHDTLSPFTSFIADSTAPEGHRGIFFEKEYQDKMPKDFKTSGLRIYTSALSWPGPLAEPEEIPYQLSDCEQVDPCAHADMLGTGPSDRAKYRGVCAFFFASAGDWRSPGMHRQSEEWPNGTRDNECKTREQPQKLNDLVGKYFPDGRLVFEDNALRFWGPTNIHNPAGKADVRPDALDEVFHITFSTDVLVPKELGGKYDYTPEERINKSKQEYMVNLNDDSTGESIVCPTNTQNKFIGDKKYSSWKYFSKFLVKDKEGKIPAGCPDIGNTLPGGRAYLRGRPMDPITGAFSVAAVTKFSNQSDNTFVFKDVQIYIVLNGWMCDPNGSEAENEGSKCFDQKYNDRDGIASVGIMKDEGSK